MGLAELSYLIREATPDAIISNQKLEFYKGKVIALDAYQYLYQFMSPRGRSKNKSTEKIKIVPGSGLLLQTFYSCVKLLQNGIKPVYVFDGAAPKLKQPVIKERSEKREEAIVELKKAEEKGDIDKFNEIQSKTVKVGRTEVKSCTGLLKLLGIPYFYAPGEAEAQCAAFVESGTAYATATHDMDALIYGTKVVLRYLPLHKKLRVPMHEIHLNTVLNRLQLSLPEFIDLSILLGCDYCKGIKGIGAHRALELIHKYRSIENMLDNVSRCQLVVPENWLFKEARMQFLNPNVKNCEHDWNFKWTEVDHDGILKYLEDEKHFDKSTVRDHLKSIPKLNFTT